MINMKQLNFFNTTELYGEDLNEAIRQATTQDEKILVYFQNYPNTYFSPDYVYEKIFTEETPRTSVRRSFTTLTKKGLIRKSNRQVLGSYGRLTYTWILNKN